MTFKEGVEQIVGIPIAKGDYLKRFLELDRDGRISKKQIIEILALLCTYAEENYENTTKPDNI